MIRFLIGLISFMCVSTFAAGGHVTSQSLPQPKTSVVPLNRVLVTVNSVPITQHQYDLFYDRAVKRIQMMKQSIPTNTAKFRKYILKQYILRVLQLQLAKSYGIKVTPKQVSQQLHTIAKQNKMTLPQLQQKVQLEGYSFAEFKKEIKDEILIGKLQHQAVGSSININDNEVKAKYAELKQASQYQKRYHVIDVLTPLGDQPTKHDVLRALTTSRLMVQHLRKGTKFHKIKDENDTDLGWRPLSDMPDLFANAVKKLKVNGVAGPLRAANGYHALKLLGIKSSKAPLPTKGQVAQEIYMTKMQEQLGKWLKTIYSQAAIKTLHPV